jgi:hypothetical protein
MGAGAGSLVPAFIAETFGSAGERSSAEFFCAKDKFKSAETGWHLATFTCFRAGVIL